MSKRDLLRCELGADSRLFAVHNLLNPKPKFELPGSELLGRLKAFIPELRVANAELADPQVLKEKQLEEPVAAEKVHIRSLFPERESRRAFRRTGTKSRKQYINMVGRRI